MTEQTFSLPHVATVSVTAPFKWLSGAWQDYLRAPLPFMIYGIILSAISAMIAWALVFSGAFAWVFVLAGGFFLVAPILAMGLYEGGRMLEQGQSPGLTDIVLVREAVRLDLAYLGLALFLIYMFWTRIAQIVYALSTPSDAQDTRGVSDLHVHNSRRAQHGAHRHAGWRRDRVSRLFASGDLSADVAQRKV